MWETIKWYGQKGYKSLAFGRTDPGNEGLLQFKNAWGTTEEKLNYYKYDLRNESFISAQSGLKISYNFFKHMPVPILRLTGNILYRHAG
jgi:hypothetical protein